jgi:hypothetical protein
MSKFSSSRRSPAFAPTLRSANVAANVSLPIRVANHRRTKRSHFKVIPPRRDCLQKTAIASHAFRRERSRARESVGEAAWTSAPLFRKEHQLPRLVIPPRRDRLQKTAIASHAFRPERSRARESVGEAARTSARLFCKEHQLPRLPTAPCLPTRKLPPSHIRSWSHPLERSALNVKR